MTLKYKLNETKDGLVVTGGEDLEGELIIPSEQEYEGKMYPVTMMGLGAFFNCTSLTSIVIPDSVTEIGGEAFYDCENLKSIVIPDSVTAIEESALCGCTSLTNIVIPDSVMVIGEGAFAGCTSLTSIVIPDSVTAIEEYAFCDCENLTNIVIPDSVMAIGEGAFAGCKDLTSIKVLGNNHKYDSRGNCNAIIETATNRLITGCATTVIPDSVTEIGEDAFEWCDNLQHITISNAWLLIKAGVFQNWRRR